MTTDAIGAEKAYTAADIAEAADKAKAAIKAASDIVDGHEQGNLLGVIGLYEIQLKKRAPASKGDVIAYLIGRSDKALDYDPISLRNEIIGITQFARALGIYHELEAAKEDRRLARGAGEPSAER